MTVYDVGAVAASSVFLLFIKRILPNNILFKKMMQKF